MKTTLILPILLASSLTASAANYYRTGNADTDWTNLDNWTLDETGDTPATALPGSSDTIYIYENGKGTKTVFDGSMGNRGISALYMNSADIEFSGATFNISNRIAPNGTAGTEGNLNVNNILITNGSNVTTWLYFGTGAAYMQTNLTVTGNSTFTATGSTWNHFQLVQSANSKANFLVDKGSTVTLAANFATNGTHNQGQNSEVVADIKGSFKAAGFFIADSNNSKGTVNVYGSADVSLTGSVGLNKTGATLNFVMQDVSSSRLSHVTGGLIDDTSMEAILRTTAFSNLTGTLNLDLADFSVDEGMYAFGEAYAVALISASDEIFSIDKMNVLNANLMGDEWELNGADKSEWLVWQNNTLFLNVTFTGEIPEPSTYAVCFGALALLLAVYRRKR